MSNSDNEALIKATCPNCGSKEFWGIRSKDRNYTFVLGIADPNDKNGTIIPYLPVRVLACSSCNRIVLETDVETVEDNN